MSLLNVVVAPNDQKKEGYKYQIFINDFMVSSGYEETEDEAREEAGEFLKELKYSLRDLWAKGPRKG